MLKLNNNRGLSLSKKTETFISSEYGIKVDIVLVENKQVIKVYNHLSLFSLINKIRLNFDFSIHHKKEKNEFVIVLESGSNV